MTDAGQGALKSALKNIENTLLSEILIQTTNAQLAVGQLQETYPLEAIKDGLEGVLTLQHFAGPRINQMLKEQVAETQRTQAAKEKMEEFGKRFAPAGRKEI
jgi:hypothetical protein